MSKQQGRVMFADRILAGLPWVYPEQSVIPVSQQSQFAEKLTEAIKRTATFDIQNVEDYLEVHGKPEYQICDFETLRPPFEECWFEFKLATYGLRACKIQVGCYCQTVSFDSPEESAVEIRKHSRDERNLSGDYRHIVLLRPILDVPDIIKAYHLPVPLTDGVTPHGFISFRINDHGAIDVDSVGSCSPYRIPNSDDTPSPFVLPVQIALQFLNCKNVRMAAHEPEAKLSKVFQKRHGRPLLRYHTIEIEPMKKVLETEGGIAHNGLKKALHICRGHFATYSDDKPLFGRVTGTFWKPAHVRGAASEGVVLSNYNVHAPAKAGGA